MVYFIQKYDHIFDSNTKIYTKNTNQIDILIAGT